MQFNDDVRVYKGTVTKVKQLRHKTVYVCEYDDADTVQHTEEELRNAHCTSRFAVRVISARL